MRAHMERSGHHVATASQKNGKAARVVINCDKDVATDGVRKASRSRAFDSPVPGENRDMRTARPTDKGGDEYLMQQLGNSIRFSASDLVGHLDCHHLTALDAAVARGKLSKPKIWDPVLQTLVERGLAHERQYVER